MVALGWRYRFTRVVVLVVLLLQVGVLVVFGGGCSFLIVGFLVVG